MDRFDGDLADIFDLQDRITASVAGAIEPSLSQAEIKRTGSKPTESLTAYDCYLRALALYNKFGPDSVAAALPWLERAITADPAYSSAYALAAACRHARITQGWSTSDEDRAQAVHMAALAVETGKDDPSALAMAGRVMGSIGREHEAGLAHIERALTLNPNSALALQSGGWISWQIGRHQECIDYNTRAMLLSPLDPLTYRCHVGIAWSCFFTGRFEEAIVAADKAYREQPNFLPALRVKLAAAAMAGRTEDMEDALVTLAQRSTGRLAFDADEVPHVPSPGAARRLRDRVAQSGPELTNGCGIAAVTQRRSVSERGGHRGTFISTCPSSHLPRPLRAMLPLSRRRPMMAALVKVLSRSMDMDVDAEELKTILIFCGGGLLLSLAAAMTYGLNIAADLF